MLEIELEQLWRFVSHTPEFFIFGMGASLFFLYVTGEDRRLFTSNEAVRERYYSFGGYGPAIAAVVPGILFGIAIELLFLSVLYLAALSTPSMGVSEFQSAATVAVMIGASFGYWGYLETQSWIRNSLLYRGWA